jgi:purine nucleosidase/pyrimidine-specific ribonucleoside hydrolase
MTGWAVAVPVVLDCDPGHDDAFAIWLAAGHPALRLLAITTVGGNGRVEHTTHNARVVCTVAGIRDVPIAAGADGPLVRVLVPAEDIHGVNALGGPVLPEPDVELDPRGAVELLRAVLIDSAEPVVVIATGPLTNIALLLRLHPQVVPKIAQIAWMGGSTARGNVTPYAEFNCWVDPEAAAAVLARGIPFGMVGLNVTHQALVTPEVMDRLGAVGNATAAFGVELLTFFRATYQRAEGMAAPPLHDPVAVALVAEPHLVRTVHTRVDVELHGTETAGATSVDLHDKLGRPPNARVALDLDVPRFWATLTDALARMR